MSSEEEENFKKCKMIGVVRCPCCADKTIGVRHEPSHKNFFIWKTTNWSRHLQDIHGAVKIKNSKHELIEKMACDVETVAVESESNKIEIVAIESESNAVEIVAVESESNAIEIVAIESKSNTVRIVGMEFESNAIEIVAIPSESNEINSYASCPPKTDLKSRLVSYSDSSENSDDDDHSFNQIQGKFSRFFIIFPK